MSAAGAPFVFRGSVELLESLGRKAQDERELIELLEQVVEGSIFYHTCGYFLQQRLFVRPYGTISPPGRYACA